MSLMIVEFNVGDDGAQVAHDFFKDLLGEVLLDLPVLRRILLIVSDPNLEDKCTQSIQLLLLDEPHT